jgi:transposase
MLELRAFKHETTLMTPDQMLKRGRPIAKLEVTPIQQAELAKRLAARKGPVDEKLRIQIVLACAGGISGSDIARQLGTSTPTVSKWRRRFMAYGIDGLRDSPRAGRPATIPVEKVQQILEATRKTKPANASHWSVRLMSRESGISRASVQRIWSKYHIKPHLHRSAG